MAPEIIKKLEYDCSVDIWALGVMTYIMLSGRPPFKGQTKEEVFVEITTKNINFTSDTWSHISKEAKNFVKSMLVRDPKQRATAEESLASPFIKNNVKDETELTDSVILNISENIKEFRKNTAFQAAVMTYILSQNDKALKTNELKEIFNALDKSKDGTL